MQHNPVNSPLFTVHNIINIITNPQESSCYNYKTVLVFLTIQFSQVAVIPQAVTKPL